MFSTCSSGHCSSETAEWTEKAIILPRRREPPLRHRPHDRRSRGVMHGICPIRGSAMLVSRIPVPLVQRTMPRVLTCFARVLTADARVRQSPLAMACGRTSLNACWHHDDACTARPESSHPSDHTLAHVKERLGSPNRTLAGLWPRRQRSLPMCGDPITSACFGGFREGFSRFPRQNA